MQHSQLVSIQTLADENTNRLGRRYGIMVFLVLFSIGYVCYPCIKLFTGTNPAISVLLAKQLPQTCQLLLLDGMC